MTSSSTIYWIARDPVEDALYELYDQEPTPVAVDAHDEFYRAADWVWEGPTIHDFCPQHWEAITGVSIEEGHLTRITIEVQQIGEAIDGETL